MLFVINALRNSREMQKCTAKIIKKEQNKYFLDFSSTGDTRFFIISQVNNTICHMIQRIQSLFILLAVAACVLLFFIPIANYLNDLSYYKLYVTGFRNMVPGAVGQFSTYFTVPLMVILVAVIGISLASVLLYKKRILQIRTVAFAILMNLVFVVVLFFYSDKIYKAILIEPEFTAGTFLPLFSLLFLVLANRFIRKDDKKVRSMDRLR
jgi:hypothetical protein